MKKGGAPKSPKAKKHRQPKQKHVGPIAGKGPVTGVSGIGHGPDYGPNQPFPS